MEFLANATTQPDLMETTKYNYLVDQNKIFSEAEAILVNIFLAFLAAFGIVANGITLIVILRMPRSIFNIILASLCVSDLLSAIDSPFVIYRSTYGYRYYELSEPVCKIAQAVDFWTTILTIQHILTFAILRFISVYRPHTFKRITKRHVAILVGVIWVETLLVGFVCFVLWPGVAVPPPHAFGGRSCRMKKKWVPMAMVYSLYVFPILLYLPMLLVIVISLALFIMILRQRFDEKSQNRLSNQSRVNREKKENFALLQLTLIIASFLLGYIPDISYRATAIIAKFRRMPLTPRVEWVYSVTAHCLLRISECLNPVFYNLGSSTMRRATKEFLGKCALCKKAESPNVTSTSNTKSTEGPSTGKMNTTKI